MFSKTNCQDDKLLVYVKNIYTFDNFEELYQKTPLDKCGYYQEELENAHPDDMNEYYSLTKQNEYGVVGIEVALLKLRDNFEFKNYNFLTNNEIDLVINEKTNANPSRGYVPAYKYDIYLNQSKTKIGFIDLRIGYTIGLFYGGHIGYTIFESFRGHRYAQKACELIFEVAKAHQMKRLFISCNPDNIASKKTLENLGLNFLGVFKLPTNNEMYLFGDREKAVYEWIDKSI